MRVISFEISLRAAMDNSMSKKEVVSVVDYQVRLGVGGKTEIF